MPPDIDLTGMRVLLVDDHQDAANSLARLLDVFGCDVRVCYDGGSVEDIAGTFRPHAVFLDIRLPDVAGTEVCRRLRAIEALAGTRMMAMTGASDPSTRDAVDAAGFDRTLTKPVDLETVLKVLADVAEENGLS